VQLRLADFNSIKPADIEAAPGSCQLLIVIKGILSCYAKDSEFRLLPKEVCCADSDQPLRLASASRSEPAICIQLSIKKTERDKNLPFVSRYISDDLKENRLYEITSRGGSGRALNIGAPHKIYLTRLNKYETVLLQNQNEKPIIVLPLTGSISVNGQAHEALDDPEELVDATLTVTGQVSAEALIVHIDADE
jgi:hypothetical protein